MPATDNTAMFDQTWRSAQLAAYGAGNQVHVGPSISAMSSMDDWSPEERHHYRQFMARIEAVMEERLADYRRRDVYVFDMFIHPDDDSDGEPNLWMACDHYTGEEIQTVTAEDLPAFYAEHEDWVEYTGLLDEVREELSDE